MTITIIEDLDHTLKNTAFLDKKSTSKPRLEVVGLKNAN